MPGRFAVARAPAGVGVADGKLAEIARLAKVTDGRWLGFGDRESGWKGWFEPSGSWYQYQRVRSGGVAQALAQSWMKREGSLGEFSVQYSPC